jgi:RNA polymerase sigma factor (sigma-70 family)
MTTRQRPEEACARARDRDPRPDQAVCPPGRHPAGPPKPGRIVPPDLGSRPPELPADPAPDRVDTPGVAAALCACARAFFDRRLSRLEPDPDSESDWNHVYHSLGPILDSVARGGRRGLLEPDDACQEAWLALIIRIGRYRPGDGGPEFPAWLAVVVRNWLASQERRAARRPRASLGREEAGALVGREEDPADTYERALARAAVRDALAEARDHLPEATYLVVVLRWIEERTTPEIAEALGMTASQVRDRHRRAVPVLRLLLSRRLGGDRGRPATTHSGRGPREPGPGEVAS